MENLPSTPTPQRQAPRSSNIRWIILGAILLVPTLCLCFVLALAIKTLTGPEIDNAFWRAICTVENPDLTEDDCARWWEEIQTNYAKDLEECRAATPDPLRDEPNSLYDCLVVRGLGPNDVP